MTDQERCPLCGSEPVLLPDWSGATCRECPLPISCWPAVQALKDRVAELEQPAREDDGEAVTTLRELIERLQWSGTAYGFGGQTAPRCPICTGINPKFKLNVGGGSYHEGKGHSEDCPIPKALGVELGE